MARFLKSQNYIYFSGIDLLLIKNLKLKTYANALGNKASFLIVSYI